MKKHINGRVYDTEKAKMMAQNNRTKLYRKRTMEYFLCINGEKISPLTYHQAKCWAFKYLPEHIADDMFASKVREYRMKRGMTQKEVAEKAGVFWTFIGKLERGECNVKNISTEYAEKIADALGVSIEDLWN